MHDAVGIQRPAIDLSRSLSFSCFSQELLLVLEAWAVLSATGVGAYTASGRDPFVSKIRASFTGGSGGKGIHLAVDLSPEAGKATGAPSYSIGQRVPDQRPGRSAKLSYTYQVLRPWHSQGLEHVLEAVRYSKPKATFNTARGEGSSSVPYLEARSTQQLPYRTQVPAFRLRRRS